MQLPGWRSMSFAWTVPKADHAKREKRKHMVFSSVTFIFYFLPAVFAGYFIVRKEFRNAFLLASSIIFYAWGEPKFVFILILSILINYLSGLFLSIKQRGIRKTVLCFSVVFNIGLLLIYKYLDFAITIANSLFERAGSSYQIPLKGFVLPIGLSFFTFQGLSYVIDIYCEKAAAQKNPLYVALYISMFPQLVAGPIVRYESVEAEITQRQSNLDDIYCGLRRFIAGLGKKVLIADVLARPADLILVGGGIAQLTLSKAWLGAVCYTLQIYFDFSGYSDMAIGLGRIFGFHFSENFLLPYRSVSITEFWRRWHVSLGSWFRDYLYIPMGGSRKGNVYLHLMIVFLCTGIWHGADYTFIFWGIWHGLFILAERILKQKKTEIKVPKIIRWFYTSMVVLIGWVFFKADTLQEGAGCIAAMFGHCSDGFKQYTLLYYLDMKVFWAMVAGLAASLGIPRYIYERCRNQAVKSAAVNVFLLAVLFVSMISVVNGNYSPFIYFRF